MKLRILTLGTVFAMSLSNVAFANEHADSRFFYVGLEGGLEEPVKKKFSHKSTKTVMTLKRTPMYGANIGYSFYPKMIVELSGSYQPTYKLGYVLPAGKITPETPGKTKVGTDVYMMNMIYEFVDIATFTPYLIGGFGVAKIKIKPTISKFGNLDFFRIHKNNMNCPAWQIGLGVSKELSSAFSVQASAKLQVVSRVKIKYSKLNPAVMAFENQTPIRKTIGTGEFSLGFRYKLPL